MKRWLLVGILAVGGVFAAPHVAEASVNDFRISHYAIDYYLGKDGSNRSTLKTIETITAEFPSIDQNHGIERAIPKSYDGHSTHVTVKSVKGAEGNTLPYSEYDSNDNLVVRIGDKDSYVHGTHTYEVSYVQHDVTRFFKDTNHDEFYWDTNGTEWKVPIDQLSVRLHLDDNVAGAVSSGQSACYLGNSGSQQRCDLAKQTESLYGLEVSTLGIGENATLALGFTPQTFAPYQKSFGEKLLAYYLVAFYIISALGVGIIIWLSGRWYRWSNRKKELGTIIPEYLPPPDVSVTTAASIGSFTGSAFTAQLLDFAVRHYVKIYQTKEKGFLRPAEYDIEIIRDIKDLKVEEQEILTDIFNGKVQIGSRLALKSLQNNTSVYSRMQNNDGQLKKLVRGTYAIRHRDAAKQAWFKRAGWTILVLSIVTVNPVLFIASLTSFVLGYALWPLTDEGLSLNRYLLGLKEYIRVAEVDRLKMLQSPEGAQKVSGVDVTDGAQLVKLYERVLPYAVLFNQEKEWTKRIGDYYAKANSSPDWYTGNAVFNAAVFSSAISGFSTAASYSSASSSSSGGSSGGGSSGGGGGGGGGGGW